MSGWALAGVATAAGYANERAQRSWAALLALSGQYGGRGAPVADLRLCTKKNKKKRLKVPPRRKVIPLIGTPRLRIPPPPCLSFSPLLLSDPSLLSPSFYSCSCSCSFSFLAGATGGEKIYTSAKYNPNGRGRTS